MFELFGIQTFPLAAMDWVKPREMLLAERTIVAPAFQDIIDHSSFIAVNITVVAFIDCTYFLDPWLGCRAVTSHRLPDFASHNSLGFACKLPYYSICSLDCYLHTVAAVARKVTSSLEVG